ncbi:hypothetical protein I2W78_05690 [Streptomyces spinoverrucosus]|uniref:hypothetical protein n=1 Tax=Streptomyces spinoverrucosus TaxID=284043 RepID=UPI0018C366B5|nr:hypothetical protein [Streptomyces spinoverrucosus]MBG0851357.1 hypothetical protein [Streptomyces spinoverrucosus]
MFVRRDVISPVSALLALALLTAGCASGGGIESKPGSPSSTTPHGYVEGATEAAEQQSRLLLGDPGTGDTAVLDLISGKVHETERRTGVTALTTDGRFGYFHGANGTHVLDSGAWMVDHGDHVHYYRATIRDVGQLPGGTGTLVRGDAGVTVVTGADGRAAVYRRAGLEKGTIGAPVELPGSYAGAVVPYEEHLIALTRGGEGPARVVVLDRSGKRVASPEAGCEDPRGDAVTRRGLVLGCADGALLVHEDDGAFTAEKIPYGEDVPKDERATAFRHRAGSTTLTAPAGTKAVWVLDVTERAWTRVRTGPVVAANTAGEGSPLIVLETDGALHGYDIADGKESAVTDRLLQDVPEIPTDAATAPVLEIDRSRAYLNDPEGKRVYEIDYNDSLRVARTFDLDIRPSMMAETGR